MLFRSTSETIIPLNGSVLNYSGWSQRDEWLHSMGPGALREALVVQILATDAKKPLDVRYSFFTPRRTPPAPPPAPARSTAQVTSTTVSTVPRSSTTTTSALLDLSPTGPGPSTPAPGPQWATGPWMSCSRTCDTGWQSRTVQCKDPQGKLAKGCPLGARPSAFKHCLAKKC